MKSDKYSNPIFEENDIIELMYQNRFDAISPLLYVEKTQNIKNFEEQSNIKFSDPLTQLYDISEFDKALQSDWQMPDEYKNIDIAKWVLDQCKNQDQLQRCGAELLEFQRRNMMDLLRWLKYFVDFCRSNNIVWGVGRGSSVSSFVLYLIGVHKIDPIKYNLDWQDFLR